MMWLNNSKNQLLDDTDDDDDDDSCSSGEEIPIWVRGEQRWVSGITSDTTCQDIIQVLLTDEQTRGRNIGLPEQYHITERWRGVEQPLEAHSIILDIWNAWGTAQPEVKISLRRIKQERPSSRRTRCRSDTNSIWSDRSSAWKTIHPKRLHALQNEKQPSSTEELLKLVLAQGEVIRRQLKKLRNSEHQIGYLEDKTHRARVRKHGSNYLLETYLKGLSEAVDPNDNEENLSGDKNSDSGVMTEGDSEQSNPNNNNNKQSRTTETFSERFSPSSEEFNKDMKDEDTSSTLSEATVKEQTELFEMVIKLNKRLLKEEECLVRLDANLRKYEKHKKTNNNNTAHEDLNKALITLRNEMAKSACEMQHNEIVLEETSEMLETRRQYLDNLHKDLANEDEEHEMLQALMFSSNSSSSKRQKHQQQSQNYDNNNYHSQNTKELLDTLV